MLTVKDLYRIELDKIDDCSAREFERLFSALGFDCTWDSDECTTWFEVYNADGHVI